MARQIGCKLNCETRPRWYPHTLKIPNLNFGHNETFILVFRVDDSRQLLYNSEQIELNAQIGSQLKRPLANIYI